MGVLNWFRSATPSPRPAWSVVDLETTGLRPSTDRVVEIAVIRLDKGGRELAEWTTLVDPQRDVGASHIHGLRARDLYGAPTFTAIADELLAFVAGTVLVAHNARFDASFLHAECMRAGRAWGPPECLCTMTLPVSLGLVSSRSLVDCCSELGIALEDHHTALADAQATAAILSRMLPPRGYTVPRPAPGWQRPPTPPALRLRTDPPMPRQRSYVGSLASRIGVPAGLDVSEEAATSYMALLDRALEDRHLTEDEVDALADLARDWGISADALTRLHLGYLNALWRLALADGVVTAAERDEIETVAELLGVPLAPIDHAAELATAIHTHPPAPEPAAPVTHEPGGTGELVGKSVCFTGESVCSIGRVALSREDQERLAADAGMIVKSGVSRRLDVLVLADPGSQSGKARRAAELGVRRIAEPVFWRMLGVRID